MNAFILWCEKRLHERRLWMSEGLWGGGFYNLYGSDVFNVLALFLLSLSLNPSSSATVTLAFVLTSHDCLSHLVGLLAGWLTGWLAG